MVPPPSTENLSEECGNFSKWKNKKHLGSQGEGRLADFLKQEEFEILHRNWRTPYGEVDLVATKENTLYIIEVKTRNKWSPGDRPLVGAVQLKRLRGAALWIWQSKRDQFKKFKCVVGLVTRREIKWINLPLLYDST